MTWNQPKPNMTASTSTTATTATVSFAPPSPHPRRRIWSEIRYKIWTGEMWVVVPPTAPSVNPMPSRPALDTTPAGSPASPPVPEAIGRILDNRLETGNGNFERLVDVYRSEGVGLVICQELGIPSTTTVEQLREALR